MLPNAWPRSLHDELLLLRVDANLSGCNELVKIMLRKAAWIVPVVADVKIQCAELAAELLLAGPISALLCLHEAAELRTFSLSKTGSAPAARS